MVCAALAREQGFEVLALTIDYNQRHRVEIEAARRIASSLAHKHIVLPLDLRAFGGSALTSNAAVPKDGIQPGIPITMFPPATSSCSVWRLAGQRSKARATYSLGSTRSIIPAILTAVPNSSPALRSLPVSRRRQGPRDASSPSMRRFST